MPYVIRTNNVPRDIVPAYDLTPKERANYQGCMDEERIDECTFVRYHGYPYLFEDFQRLEGTDDALKGWDGYHAESFSSGVLVKFAKDDAGHVDHERVICGNYYVTSEI